jgi:hypothetical protein
MSCRQKPRSSNDFFVKTLTSGLRKYYLSWLT